MTKYFLGGLLAGAGAFIMPCIYAMVPITLSFFTSASRSRGEVIRTAIYYSLSIIAIFTVLGLTISMIVGHGALNKIASGAFFNILVFILFVLFALSFFGAFDLTLPGMWGTKISTRSGFGNFMGIFFMALTLVIVSFSCTVPFIGTLLVLTSKGSIMAPLIGFLGFSVALALPFTLLILFPIALKKSGTWMNTVKVSLGFIELALALKFLSSADLAYHWRILDREVFLSIWIAIFGLLGLYLLGKIKFKHEATLLHLSITRLVCAIVVLSLTMYMIPGLWGAPLNAISGWLPEVRTQDFNLSKTPAVIRKVKFSDILQSEIEGVNTFFDYDEALAAAKEAKKLLMIDFTGHSCINCRKMEHKVLNHSEVVKRLQDNFIVVSLYVDDKTMLPEGKSMGEKNLELEVKLTQNNSQPQYVFVNSNGTVIKNAGGYNPDVDRFISMLDSIIR